MGTVRLNGAVFAVGIIVLVAGWAVYLLDRPPKGKELFWYKTVVVTNENGRIYATPDTLRMGVKDMVRWLRPSGQDFRVEFKNTEFPFAESEFSAERAKKYKRPEADTPFDDFKYSLIFESDTLDPIIKVEEDPPPGGDSTSYTP
jgi:hypothetical protein